MDFWEICPSSPKINSYSKQEIDEMLKKMEEDLGDIWADVEKGDLSRVTGWLKENIHRHASFKKPGTLFEEVCGKFDATYYTDYLTEKYTALYNL